MLFLQSILSFCRFSSTAFFAHSAAFSVRPQAYPAIPAAYSSRPAAYPALPAVYSDRPAAYTLHIM
jgi:hypothetical protein